jgi:translation initiation factor 1
MRLRTGRTSRDGAAKLEPADGVIQQAMVRDPDARLVYSTDPAANAKVDAAARVKTARPAPAGSASAGGKAGIRLRLDRRSAGRLVTVISGLPGGPKEWAVWARELRTACGVGGTVKPEGIELQGDQREKVERQLEERGLSWRRAGG